MNYVSLYVKMLLFLVILCTDFGFASESTLQSELYHPRNQIIHVRRDGKEVTDDYREVIFALWKQRVILECARLNHSRIKKFWWYKQTDNFSRNMSVTISMTGRAKEGEYKCDSHQDGIHLRRKFYIVIRDYNGPRKKLYASHGKQVKLECFTLPYLPAGIQSVSYVWYNQSGQYFSGNKSVTINMSSDYDEGEYECNTRYYEQGNSKSNKRVKRWFKIILKVKHRIREVIFAAFKQKVKLECYTLEDTNYEYAWFNQTKQFFSGDESVNITMTGKDKEGEYECNTFHDYEQGNWTKLLQRRFYIVIKDYNGPRTKVYISLGKQVELKCFSLPYRPAGIQEVSYLWYNNAGHYISDNKSVTFRMSSERYGGEYECNTRYYARRNSRSFIRVIRWFNIILKGSSTRIY